MQPLLTAINPYRVTKGGFDWETIGLDNPWAYIGYWGDHQIIYLLKFLEFIEDHYPGKLNKLYSEACLYMPMSLTALSRITPL